jgi:DNA primase
MEGEKMSENKEIVDFFDMIQTKRIKILCPFHTERTASCVIDMKHGKFHCFGCGVSGIVFSCYDGNLHKVTFEVEK